MTTAKSFTKYFSHSFIATLVRAFLTLALVKLVSNFGGVGALGALGTVQNSLAIGSSIATLSTQSGVSARLASGADEAALKHSFHIAVVGVCLLAVILGVFYLFSFSLNLTVDWLLFLLAAFGLGLNGLVGAALVGNQKLVQLVYMYFVTGSATLIWIFFSGAYSAEDFAIGICIGAWLGAIVGLICLPITSHCFNLSLSLLPQYFGLIKYGGASLASVLSINTVYLIGRNSVSQSGSKLDSDLFEVGLRLNSLLDMFIIVPIGTVMIALIAKAASSSKLEGEIYLYGLTASATLSILAGIFLFFFGDFVVTIIFSRDFVNVLEYLYLIMGIQFLRCLAAAALLKQMIVGNTFFMMWNELLYFCAFLFFLKFLPLETGSLVLVFSSILCAVIIYAILPIFYLFQTKTFSRTNDFVR